MTRKIKYPLAITLLAAVSFAIGWYFLKPGPAAAEATAAAPKTLYTCGMHPQVIQDYPGNCPICGMKLTRMKSATGDSGASDSSIFIDPVTTQNMGIRTATVTKGPLRRVIRTVGNIDYDETALADVTTKFKGWLEKLYVDATGKLVMRGDPLFEIYSPELYSAQTEYVLALQRTAGTDRPSNAAMLSSARLRLKFFDLSDGQIAELEKTLEPKKTLRVNAPIDGFVTEKMVVQGMMIEAGMKLYRLADLGLVWVYAEVYEQDLPFIRLGQEALVSLSYLSGRQFRGRVTYVYPTVDPKTRTARVRMEFHNPGYLLKPGMFANVQLQAELEPSALLVPDMAILRSGEKNTVFVALEGGRFDPRTVTLGPRAEDDMVQVLSGLEEGERVVTSGQFMLDSESQLREALQKMREPKSPEEAAVASRTGDESKTSANENGVPAAAEPLLFVCPMPEHVSIEYQQPGECPLCHMALVPVSAEALARMQPGGKVEHYTCPMSEHADVKLNQPGKCPKCGMTLIPVMPEPAPPQPAAVPATFYTCPMKSHADVVSDHPGKCPKCEMDLVETGTVKHGKIAEENWRKQHPVPAPAAPPP